MQRDWERERTASEGRREETVPASRTRSQPAAMAGDALQSPGPSE